MARPPISDEELIARYGPHLNEAPPGRLGRRARGRPGRRDALLLLRAAVRDQAEGPRQRGRRLRAVVRLPVQRGQALPEGRQALPAGQPPRPAAAPDGARPRRARRVPARSAGTRRSTGSSARSAASRPTYGDDAFAMLSGVSLTNEKSYLIGKFARLALHTANLDYNGRFCMVSAGAGNKKALGVDRAPNPWSDIPLADVVWVAGSNVAETFPITTSYIWRARDRGARLIVQDPRVVPLARTADLFLPVRPGSDSALFGAVLHELIRHDWLDHEFIDAHTVDFDEAAAAVADMTPRWAAEITGVPAARIEQAAEWWGTSATGMMLHARGIEQQTKGVDNVLGGDQPRAGDRASSASRAAACRPSPGRATARAAASTATSATSSPATGTSPTPSTGPTSPSVWGCDESEIPGKGMPAAGDHRGHPRRRRSRACCRSASTRSCRRPTPTSPPRRSTSSSSTPSSTSSCPSPAQHADVVLPGLAARGGRGHVDQRRGPHHQDQRRRRRRPARRGSTGRSSLDLAERLGHGEYFPLRTTPRRSSTSCAARRPAAPPTTGAPPGNGSRPSTGLFWPIPEVGPPRHPPPLRGREVLPSRRQGPLPRGAVPGVGRGGRRRVPGLADHGSGRQPVPVGHPDPPHRRRSSTSTPSRCARCTRSWPSRPRRRRRRPRHRHVPSRGDDAARQRREHDPARHRVHPVPLAGREGGEPADQPGGRPALEDARVQGRRGAGRPRRRRRTTTDDRDLDLHEGPA